MKTSVWFAFKVVMQDAAYGVLVMITFVVWSCLDGVCFFLRSGKNNLMVRVEYLYDAGVGPLVGFIKNN